MTTTILLLKASVLLASALVAARLLGRGSASTRHGLWSATFVALLALPLLGSVAPALYLPVPATWPAAANASVQPVAAAPMTSAMPVAPPRASATAADAGTATTTSRAIARPPWPDASMVALAIWFTGTAVAIGALLVSLIRVRLLSARSLDADVPRWRESADALARQLGLRRATIVFSDAVRTPMAGGLWRPTIFLPAEATAWDAERRAIVLAHELSHFVGRDPLRHIAARLALACYWFHPLAWLAARHSSLAREQACDEAVLSLGIRPSAYARVLLDLAEGMTAPRLAAALPMVERSLLERRIMAILDDRSRPAGSRPLLVACSAALVTLALAAAQPAVQATTTIVVPPAQLPHSQPTPSLSMDSALGRRTGTGSPAALPAPLPAAAQPARGGDCWSDSYGGSFSGSSTSTDIGGRTVVSEMIGTRNGDRVVQTHFGDLRVCMLAQGAVGLERGKPSEWSAPRVLIETRRGGSTEQLEIRDGRQLSWRVNGAERAVDAAAQEWRAAILAVLDTTWELSTLRGEVSTLRGQISTVRGEESTLRGQISTFMGEVSTMRGRQSMIRGDESTLRGEISTIRGHVSTLRGQISSARGAISTLDARRWDTSAADRDRIATRVREQENEIARVEREIRDYNEDARIAEVERRIRALDADAKTAAIDDEIRRFDLNAKTAAVEQQIKNLDVDAKIADIERRIEALDADRRARALEDRRGDEVKRLEKAVAAIR